MRLKKNVFDYFKEAELLLYNRNREEYSWSFGELLCYFCVFMFRDNYEWVVWKGKEFIFFGDEDLGNFGSK